jgi:hypothetical protein
VDEVLAFPEDGNRYELAYGKLPVSPSPRFVRSISRLRLGKKLATLSAADAGALRRRITEMYGE